ncbi:MAG: pilin [Patescibacteria group bacterium]|nr:pilin [Patescibacteria group bacterium]
MKKAILFFILIISFIIPFNHVVAESCKEHNPNWECIDCRATNCAGCYPGRGPNWPCQGGDYVQCCPPKQQGTTQTQAEEKDENAISTNEPGIIFTGITNKCKDKGECATKDLVTIAINAANLLLSLIAGVALLFFVVAGIQMIISQGNSEKISSAKSMMLNSIIGIAIALCSFVIVKFVQNAIGLEGNYVISNVIKPDKF